MELKIEYIRLTKLKAYEKNARKHETKDVAAIKASIEQFGFDDPIGVWGDDNTIVEGHGRLLAAKELGMDKVPCIRLDHLTDEQRRAYALAHNKTAELSQWLDDVLREELTALSDDMDMGLFGFDADSLDDVLTPVTSDEDDISKYAQKAKIPQYEPKGDMPEISDLVNTDKQDELVEEIKAADIPEDVRDFLILAAQRHNVFNYRNIAEFYCHQTAEVQRLMERSALVIIDINDAIAKRLCEAKQNNPRYYGERRR